MHLSLCLLNWKRKNYVINTVNNMSKFNYINDILISNGNDEQAVNKNDFIESEKIKVYNDSNINNIYGLDLRFINGLRAKNDSVIIMDDDIEISEIELNKLIEEYIKNENRIVGKWGRNIRNGYHLRDCYGDVDVVLTKLFICKKKLFNLFFICKPLIEDIYKTGNPYGNGEDIFFNFISNIYLNNKGFCLNVKGRDLPLHTQGISSNKGHIDYRKKICRHLIQNESKFTTFINNIKI